MTAAEKTTATTGGEASGEAESTPPVKRTIGENNSFAYMLCLLRFLVKSCVVTTFDCLFRHPKIGMLLTTQFYFS